MKRIIKLNAKLEIESKYDIPNEVIEDILKGIDSWVDTHKINGKEYKSTLIDPKRYIPKYKNNA